MEAVVVGSINVDIEISVPRLPTEGETVLGERKATEIGGKGANQAVALSRLGHSVRMIARVGGDHWSDLAVGQLKGERVELLEVPPAPGPTGLAVVMRGAAGESTIVVASGANGLLTAAHLETHRAALGAADAVLVQAEIPDEALTAAAGLTRGRLVVNPAPARLLPLALLERADLLVPNRLELLQLYELTTRRLTDPPPSDDYAGMARIARELPGESVVVVTLGADGCLVVHRDSAEHVPGEAVDVVDTTGAGDAFCAAVTHRWLGCAGMVEAAAFANEAAARTVSFLGAMRSLPRLADLGQEESLTSRTGSVRLE